MLYSLIKKINHNLIFIIKHKLLPKGLLARSITILILPVMISLVILGYIFYNNHWGIIGKRLATSITGEIAGVITLLDEFDNTESQKKILKAASDNFLMTITIIPNAKLSPDMEKTKNSWITSELKQSLNGILLRKNKFYLDEISNSPSITIYIQYYGSILKIDVPYKRFFSSTAYVFVLWMIVTSILLLSIASIFMKNQVRSILKVTHAAEEFGKGRDVTFKASGAAEIKKIGRAFLNMRNRIKRHLSERTYMLAGVSHDLRTPLTRMNLQLALLENEENKDLVHGIKFDVKVMEGMIDAYIAFVKGEGSEPFSLILLPELLKEAISRFDVNDKIELIIKDDINISIRKNAIIRCVNNIIGNAIRHGEKIIVTLELDQNKFAVIKVDDDGPGIEEEFIEEVFRAFYRIENSRNLKTGGIGLGLTVSKDIVNAHGGEIMLAKSALGGLQVIIKLPI